MKISPYTTASPCKLNIIPTENSLVCLTLKFAQVDENDACVWCLQWFRLYSHQNFHHPIILMDEIAFAFSDGIAIIDNINYYLGWLFKHIETAKSMDNSIAISII